MKLLHAAGTWVLLILFGISTVASTAYGREDGTLTEEDGTSVDATSMDQGVCRGLRGGARGLCNAFCVAKKCHEQEEPEDSCNNLRANFLKKTGSATFPCEEVTPTATATDTAVPATATPTNTAVLATATATNTAVPATATATDTAVPATATATDTATPATATATNTAVPATATPTNTAVPATATATDTAVPATATATDTAVPATATATDTAVPATATATDTAVPATATATDTAVPATATATDTAVPATATATDTAVPATATATDTAMPATATATNTAVPATATPTNTAVPATATATDTAVPATATATDTAVPATSTDTPANTPTGTPSQTVSATETGTPLLTPSESPTASPSATPSPSLTPTPRPTPPLSSRVCGNGTIEPGEECDDANLQSGDGCSAACRSESHPDPCADVTPVAGTNITAIRVAGSLSEPLYATSPPDDTSRLFIVERGGRIRLLEDGQVRSTPFLDLRDRVASGGELGLLALAFHPSYATNGEFFVDYTTMRGAALLSVVSRFRVSADPNVADPDSEEILLEQEQPWVAHNGGQLTFDALGYLYISFGDGGQSSNEQNNAQDPTTWLGKILRIDVDGGTPYAIPRDNPFVGPDGVLDEIWTMGYRNPWRFSIDRATGDAYIGDVGESSLEEIDVVPAGGGGENFGWCCREGTSVYGGCFNAAQTCPAADALTPPVLEYGHDEGCAVTGGFVYRGCALPDLRGTYFYGDFCSAFVRSFSYQNGIVGDERDWTAELTPGGGPTIDRIAGFGEDARGELYICDLGGEVFKIVPAPAP
jgi:cysteine-rich repeat protein